MYACSKWYHFCSGVCNVSNANILFLWIGNNDVLGYATTGGDGTDPITLLGWQVLGLMRHMMLW
jgi:hypothetical protein